MFKSRWLVIARGGFTLARRVAIGYVGRSKATLGKICITGGEETAFTRLTEVFGTFAHSVNTTAPRPGHNPQSAANWSPEYALMAAWSMRQNETRRWFCTLRRQADVSTAQRADWRSGEYLCRRERDVAKATTTSSTGMYHAANGGLPNFDVVITFTSGSPLKRRWITGTEYDV